MDEIQRPVSGRVNMAERQSENWRPPLHSPAVTGVQQAVAGLRRFFDLQAGSAWPDLKSELGAVQGRVMDVGCGSQPYRRLLSPAATYIGLDTIHAKAHFGYEMPDTLYYDGDKWPVEDGNLDYILCTETLEHVLHPEIMLAEAHRCLRPGGRMMITVPFSARWHFIPYDFWRYTPASLKYLLELAGFEDIAVYARGNALTVACYKNMALFLPLLFSPVANPLLRIAARLLGLLFLPLLFLLAAVGNLSLLGAGGDDCLGYTALVKRNA